MAVIETKPYETDMIKISFKHTCFVFVLFFIVTYVLQAQKPHTININTSQGHNIKTGSSGFNVRIADKVWSYTHPDFRKAVHELKPGWLRFFSGTMGDAFNSATGQYDLDYAYMFDKTQQYLKGYKFTEVKGPHRIFDLYQLLGEINAKLIVTINAFSETPEITEELVRFIENNNIKVEVWQFCNEPYFYVPHRERFWWNDGYDYAVKMKPHADIILKYFPDAQLALNFTWDGIWAFMKEINQYQKLHGAYWNTFSKHSYAPHIGRKESFEDAYRRANTKLLEATSINAMSEIEAYTEQDIPMVITEFGVWNKPLNGIYSGIYNVEYIMRQLQHTNTTYVGAHEVSNKFIPNKDYDHLIIEAFESNAKINTDSIPTGIYKTLEGKALQIFHKATNNVDYIYKTNAHHWFEVPGLQKQSHKSGFVQSYRGIDGYDYLVATNRSGSADTFQITVDGEPLNKPIDVLYLYSEDKRAEDAEIKSEIRDFGTIKIRPFSVTVAKWKTDIFKTPITPRIYNVSNLKKGIEITWGPVPGVIDFEVHFGEDVNNLNQRIKVKNTTKATIENLQKNKTYYISILCKNEIGTSKSSVPISITHKVPDTPQIFDTVRRDQTVTIMWKSVPDANGYILKYEDANEVVNTIDTKNVFGYRVEGLDYNKSYDFSVASYNGLGTSNFSETEAVVPKRDIPYAPRNVSAREIKDGEIKLTWENIKENSKDVAFSVLRGKKPHQFEVIASNIKGNEYIDKSISKGENYFYAVKGETNTEMSNFYSNIATPIANSSEYSIEITDVTDSDNSFIITVAYENIPLDGLYGFGISYNNISYLNVEENKVSSSSENKSLGTFKVILSKSKLVSGSRYAIKAFVNTNGKDIYSSKPDTIITNN